MLQQGERAPDFELESTAGDTVGLHDTLDQGPTVLVFFRGNWCSFCAETLLTYSDLAYDMWRHQEIDILPITGDSLPKLVEMRDRFQLTLQLVSDPDLEAVEQYTDIEVNSTYGEIPVPATYVIDTDGIVRFNHVADRPDDRVLANYIRLFIKNDFEDIYSDTYY